MFGVGLSLSVDIKFGFDKKQFIILGVKSNLNNTCQKI